MGQRLQRERYQWATNVLVLPIVERAVRLAQDIEAARARQREFEQRPLQRPVFTATLFSSLSTAGDADSTLSFSAQDGACVLCSGTELLKLALGSTPLPSLRLDPVVTADIKLPTSAPLHSVCCDSRAGRIFGLHADGWMLVWGTRHGELRHTSRLLQPAEAERAPSRPLLSNDPESQLVLFNGTWLDGQVSIA